MEAGNEGGTGTEVCSEKGGNKPNITRQGPRRGSGNREYLHGDRVHDVVTCST